MAILRKKEIKNMSEKERIKKIKELKLELMKIRAQKTSQSSNPGKIREIKKTIARMLTR